VASGEALARQAPHTLLELHLDACPVRRYCIAAASAVSPFETTAALIMDLIQGSPGHKQLIEESIRNLTTNAHGQSKDAVKHG
jgi:hypothetical protein